MFDDVDSSGPFCCKCYGPNCGTMCEEDIRAVIVNARALIAKLAECNEALAGIYTVASVHGVQYSGPTYTAERDALVAALDEVEKGGL